MESKTKLSCNSKDGWKLILIHIVIWIVAFIVLSRTVDLRLYTTEEFKKGIYGIIVFTLVFLILIRLLKVNLKSVLLYLAIVTFFLIPYNFIVIYINEYFNLSDESIHQFIYSMIFLPFLNIITTLEKGYNVNNKLAQSTILTLYMLMLVFFSCIVIKLKTKRNKDTSR